MSDHLTDVIAGALHGGGLDCPFCLGIGFCMPCRTFYGAEAATVVAALRQWADGGLIDPTAGAVVDRETPGESLGEVDKAANQLAPNEWDVELPLEFNPSPDCGV